MSFTCDLNLDFVQGHTVSYDFTSAFMFVLGGFFSNYVAALQSGHTVFSGFLLFICHMTVFNTFILTQIPLSVSVAEWSKASASVAEGRWFESRYMYIFILNFRLRPIPNSSANSILIKSSMTF